MKRIIFLITTMITGYSMVHCQVTLLPPPGLSVPSMRVADDVYITVRHQPFIRVINGIRHDTLTAKRILRSPLDTFYLGILATPGLYPIDVRYSDGDIGPRDLLYLYCYSLYAPRLSLSTVPFTRPALVNPALRSLDQQWGLVSHDIEKFLTKDPDSADIKLDALAKSLIQAGDPDVSISAAFFITIGDPVCLLVTDSNTAPDRAREFLYRLITGISDSTGKQLQKWMTDVTADPAGNKTQFVIKDPSAILNLCNNSIQGKKRSSTAPVKDAKDDKKAFFESNRTYTSIYFSQECPAQMIVLMNLIR